MGIQSQDYSFVYKTGVISHANTYDQFEKDFLSSIDALCNVFIANIITTDKLKGNGVNLDHCFVPTHQTFTSKQLPFLCPLINNQLFYESQIENRQQKLKFIIEYCIYLGLKKIAVEFNPLKYKQLRETLQKMQKIFKKSNITLLIIINLESKQSQTEQECWLNFVNFRRGLYLQDHIQICLIFHPNLIDNRLINKWFGQSLTFVAFNQDCFVLNNKGYPVLPVRFQQVYKRALKSHINIIVQTKGLVHQDRKTGYFKYFAFILQKWVKEMTKRENQANLLVDYLQFPLQPYIDNLQGQIYDIFQFDSHKYNQYELALITALQQFKQDRPCIAYYVGSGKGLILSKMMSACKATRKKVKVYCIEKNPYPIQSLKRRVAQNKWSKFVEIVQTDIKTYQMPQHPDIIFSELLGGLGDNELSPECIRWAQKNATPNTKIIPQKYTTFIRPVTASCLHKQLKGQEKESYYTVNIGKFYSPFQSKSIWNFQHPLKYTDNLQRTASVEWVANQPIIINGFQGTFDCNLYGKAYFSIVPETKDKDFFSWFPLFFSFKHQQLLQVGHKIQITIDRKSNEKQVWYQWSYQILSSDNILIKQSQVHNKQLNTAIYLAQQ